MTLADPSQEPSENQRAVDELIFHLQTGQMLGFIGAGSSRRMNYPLWPELVSQLRTLAGESAAVSIHPDSLWEAERLQKKLRCTKQFEEFIRNNFGAHDPPHQPFHTAIVNLPFRHILTTNYDPTLDCAWRALALTPHAEAIVWDDTPSFYGFFRSMDNRRYYESAYAFVHIHGPSSITKCNTCQG